MLTGVAHANCGVLTPGVIPSGTSSGLTPYLRIVQLRVFFLGQDYFFWGKKKKRKKGDILIEKKITWTFLIKNPWGSSVKRHFPTSQN